MVEKRWYQPPRAIGILHIPNLSINKISQLHPRINRTGFTDIAMTSVQKLLVFSSFHLVARNLEIMASLGFRVSRGALTTISPP